MEVYLKSLLWLKNCTESVKKDFVSADMDTAGYRKRNYKMS
jgi:hypothetical protein